MVLQMKFESVAELQQLQEISNEVSEGVSLHSLDGSIRVDAKSFIGLFTLNFTQPIKVVTESPYVIHRLEAISRRKDREAAEAG